MNRTWRPVGLARIDDGDIRHGAARPGDGDDAPAGPPREDLQAGQPLRGVGITQQHDGPVRAGHAVDAGDRPGAGVLVAAVTIAAWSVPPGIRQRWHQVRRDRPAVLPRAVGPAVAVRVIVPVVDAVAIAVPGGRVGPVPCLPCRGEPVPIGVLRPIRDRVVIGVRDQRIGQAPGDLDGIRDPVAIGVPGRAADLAADRAVDGVARPVPT